MPKYISWHTTLLSGHTLTTTASLCGKHPRGNYQRAQQCAHSLPSIYQCITCFVMRFDSHNICDFATLVFINNVLTLFVQFHLPTECRVFNTVIMNSSYLTWASFSNKLLQTNINSTADP